MITSPEKFGVAFGEDRTDEDLFAALSAHCIGIIVGEGHTLAARRLRDPKAVRAFHHELVQNCSSRKSRG